MNLKSHQRLVNAAKQGLIDYVYSLAVAALEGNHHQILLFNSKQGAWDTDLPGLAWSDWMTDEENTWGEIMESDYFEPVIQMRDLSIFDIMDKHGLKGASYENALWYGEQLEAGLYTKISAVDYGIQENEKQVAYYSEMEESEMEDVEKEMYEFAKERLAYLTAKKNATS